MRSVVPAVLLAAGLFLGVPAALADPPTFTPNPPPDVIAEATSSAGATVSFTPVVTDDNPSPTVGCSPASGSTFPLGTTNVSCTATDTGDGTTSTASFNVIVHDTTPPTITLGGSQLTVEATGPAGAAVSYAGFVSATDLVDPNPVVTCLPAAGTFAIGLTPVNCTATDAAGNPSSASFNVAVVDTTPPTISNVPANITSAATGPTTTVSYTLPTASDVVDGTDAVTCAPASGSGFSAGVTTVTCTAHDAAGNQAVPATFTVTVLDQVPPVISNVPTNITANATGPTTSVSYTLPTATDNVDGAVPVTCSPAPGAGFPIGTTQVNCSAADASGNSASASFSVTVADKTPPTLSLPGTTTAEATSSAGAAVTFSVGATDNVDPNPTVSCTPASGSTFALGQTTVNCTATDASGNNSPGNFAVNVVDTTPPSFGNVPSGLTVEANGPGGSVVTYAKPSAADLVDGPVPVFCNPPPGTKMALGTTAVTCSATDSRHNNSSASFPVHVVDTTPPVIAVPAPIVVSTTSSNGCLLPCGPVSRWLASASAADLVDPAPKITITGTPDLLPLGVVVVNFTATDASGNRASATSTITIVQATPGFTPPTKPPPARVNPPANVTGLSAKVGNSYVLLQWKNPAASDFDHVVVYRSLPTDGGLGTAVYSGPASKFRDNAVQNDTEYRYVVVSFDQAGNQSVGIAILATPSVPKLVSPSDGAKIVRPPMLRWATVDGADYYNVQLFREPQTALTGQFSSNAVKILSAWPTKAHFALHRRWRYNGHTYRLARGIYRWFVWPGYGSPSANKYGELLGESTFIVGR